MAEFGDSIRTLVEAGSNGRTFRWSSQQATLAASFPPLPMPSASLLPHIEDAVRELLHVPVGEVMVGAWSKLGALHEFRGPTGGHGEVSLADHSVEASYRPTLTVTIAPPPPLPWSLEFELRLDRHRRGHARHRGRSNPASLALRLPAPRDAPLQGT